MMVLRFSPVSSGLFSFKMSNTRSAQATRAERCWVLPHCIVCMFSKQGILISNANNLSP